MKETIPVASCEALVQLKTALRKNRRDANHRYFQIATVTPEGQPKNRTVVFWVLAPMTRRFSLLQIGAVRRLLNWSKTPRPRSPGILRGHESSSEFQH